MKAARIHQFGGPDRIVVDDTVTPVPEAGEVLVRVKAAGVGNWDALVRSGKSGISLTLPLVLGAEIAGVVEGLGSGVSGFEPGDEVFGGTNARFIGGYAEHSISAVGMIAIKPKSVNFVDAASVPIAAVTAHDMVFEYAEVAAGQSVLVHGGAGNVGAYAVQLAHLAGVRVIATAGSRDVEYVRGLGADGVIDFHTERFEDAVSEIDAVIDTVGRAVQERSFAVLRRGGVLVSSVSPPDERKAAGRGVRTAYFIVSVTTEKLARIASLVDAKKLRTSTGAVLPLAETRRAHEMLDGTVPRVRGKIVLQLEA